MAHDMYDVSSVISRIAMLQTTVAAVVDDQLPPARTAEPVVLVAADVAFTSDRIDEDALLSNAAAGSAALTVGGLARMTPDLYLLVGQFQN